LSVSVAELLLGVGSVTPLGAATLAVFDTVPEVAVTVAVTVNVTEPPDGMSIEKLLMLPFTLPGQLALQVHVTLLSSEGIVSFTLAPVTSNGPALLTTIV
jgi:hypothetical protein